MIRIKFLSRKVVSDLLHLISAVFFGSEVETLHALRNCLVLTEAVRGQEQQLLYRKLAFKCFISMVLDRLNSPVKCCYYAATFQVSRFVSSSLAF